MTDNDLRVLKLDLENLTGKICQEDYTPLLWELIKKTPDPKALLSYLGVQVVQNEQVSKLSAPTFQDLFMLGEEVRL